MSQDQENLFWQRLSQVCLKKNGRIAQGSIDYRGQDLTALSSHKDWEQIRGAKIATIFQDPMTSLDPIKTLVVRLQKLL